MRAFERVLAAAVMAFGLSSAAQAALVNCPAAFTITGSAKVKYAGGATAASACQYLNNPNPSSVASIGSINAADFFGFDDWVSNAQNQIDVNASSGSWSIANADFASFDYIMVFKSGEGTNLTAFLFNELGVSGFWTTPFTEPPFSFPGAVRSRDVSHYTIAKRSAGNNDVPEPGTLALMGVALAGLALVRRGRRG